MPYLNSGSLDVSANLCDPEAFTFLLVGSILPDGNGRKSPELSLPQRYTGEVRR